MCGIVGIFSREKVIPRGQIVRAISELDHRGPDLLSHWVSPDSKVALAHSRLSIIDLETGQQPISSRDGKVRIVVNGEFYNFEEIREELEAKGHQFSTRSDSEIALHLYREMGTRCFEKLRGEFAFILWDESNQLLLAGRDRFGIKPLFYSFQNNTLYLASEAKALFNAGLVAEWDEESMYGLHSNFALAPDKSLFKNIGQVAPGHYLLCSNERLSFHQYWDFDYPQQKEVAAQDIHEEEIVEIVREKLFEAVKVRLRADVPVGCYLSGGLDSCAVLGIAAQFASTSLKAFTICFDNKEYDESEIAKEMAEHSGASFSPVYVSPDDLASEFENAIWHSEMPFINTHGIAKYILSRAVNKQGYRCVLTGEGADEILAGYPPFRRDYILYQSGMGTAAQDLALDNLGKTNQVSKGLLLSEGTSRELAIKRMLGFVPSALETNALSGEKIGEILHPSFAKKFADFDAIWNILCTLDISRRLIGREPVHQSMYIWSKLTLPNYILTVLGDRMEMGHSVEARLPFLDHHLVDYLVKVPVSLKIKNTIEKYVLREAAKPVLTKTVYERQKHPFLAPHSTLDVSSKFFELVQDSIRSSSFASIPFYDQDALIGLLDKVPALDQTARLTVDPLLMLVTSIWCMQKQFMTGVVEDVKRREAYSIVVSV